MKDAEFGILHNPKKVVYTFPTPKKEHSSPFPSQGIKKITIKKL